MILETDLSEQNQAQFLNPQLKIEDHPPPLVRSPGKEGNKEKGLNNHKLQNSSVWKKENQTGGPGLDIWTPINKKQKVDMCNLHSRKTE